MTRDTQGLPPGGAATPVSGVYVEIYREIMADKTLLPTMPEIAVRMRAVVLAEAESEVREVAEMLGV